MRATRHLAEGRALCTVALGTCMLLLPAGAAAADGPKRAGHLFKQMQYRQAVRAARSVIRDPGSGPRDLVEAYRVEGLSLAAQGKTQQAFRAFCNLLAIDPSFRLSDDISPKLTPPFLQAVGASEKTRPVRISHRPPRAPPAPGGLAGLVLAVRLRANPYGLVHAIELRYRADNGPPGKVVVPAGKPGLHKLRLPQKLQASRLRYHLVAVNRHGAVLAGLGSPRRPLTLRPAGGGAVVAQKADTGEQPAPHDKPRGEPRERPKTGVIAGDTTSSTAAPDEADHSRGGRTVPRKVELAMREPRNEETPAPSRSPGQDDDDGASPAWYRSWWFWTAVGAVVVAGAATGIALGTRGDEGGGYHNYDILVE